MGTAKAKASTGSAGRRLGIVFYIKASLRSMMFYAAQHF